MSQSLHPLHLFPCPGWHGTEITSRACLVNQGMGRAGSERYLRCLECETGRVLREAGGGEVPEVRGGYGGYFYVVPGKEGAMKQAVKVAGEAVTLPGGQSLTVSSPGAAAAIAKALGGDPGTGDPGSAIVKGDSVIVPKGTVAEIGWEAAAATAKTFIHTQTTKRPCKNHPDRESLPGQSVCRECQQAYQREWYRKKREKSMQEKSGAQPIPASPSSIVQAAPEQEPPAPTEKLCTACKVNPPTGKSTRCAACLTALLSSDEAKRKRAEALGKTTKAAYAALRRLEAGDLHSRETFYGEILGLVPGLQDYLVARARANLRTLEAEICFRLRASMEAGAGT